MGGLVELGATVIAVMGTRGGVRGLPPAAGVAIAAR